MDHKIHPHSAPRCQNILLFERRFFTFRTEISVLCSMGTSTEEAFIMRASDGAHHTTKHVRKVWTLAQSEWLDKPIMKKAAKNTHNQAITFQLKKPNWSILYLLQTQQNLQLPFGEVQTVHVWLWTLCAALTSAYCLKMPSYGVYQKTKNGRAPCSYWPSLNFITRSFVKKIFIM